MDKWIFRRFEGYLRKWAKKNSWVKIRVQRYKLERKVDGWGVKKINFEYLEADWISLE